MSLFFTFDSKLRKQYKFKTPKISFTCAAFAQNKLPPFLRFCFKFLDFLENNKHGKDKTDDFKYPVPLDMAPEYDKIIKTPMCFSKIREKILNSVYTDINQFKSDIDLIWENCKLYNANKCDALHQKAVRLQHVTDNLWKIHSKIDNYDEAIDSLNRLSSIKKLYESVKVEFSNTYRFPEHKVNYVRTESIKAPKPQSFDKRGESFFQYPQPSEEIMKEPVSYSEKYNIAHTLDLMPVHVLSPVIKIIEDDIGKTLPRNVTSVIYFDDLSVSCLRCIQSYVEHMKESEKTVKNMYDKKILAADMLTELERLKGILEARINELHITENDENMYSDISTDVQSDEASDL